MGKQLTYVSVESNNFSLRAVGYFMAAVTERQNTEGLAALDVFDFQNNAGIVLTLEEEPNAESLKLYPDLTKYSQPVAQLLLAVGNTVWGFLHDTGHPQVKGTAIDSMHYYRIDTNTLGNMKIALSKILLFTDNQIKFSADLAVLIPEHIEELPPAEECAKEEIPAEEFAKEEIVKEEIPAEEVPKQELPAEELPAEEALKEEIVKEEEDEEEVVEEEMEEEIVKEEEEEKPKEEVEAPKEEVVEEEVEATKEEEPKEEAKAEECAEEAA